MSSPALDAREERWTRNLSRARALPPGGSLLTLTLRLPAALRLGGEYDGVARTLLGVLEAETRRFGDEVLSSGFLDTPDGPEGWLALGSAAAEAKDRALGVEEGHPWGDLADIDVLDTKGRRVGRADRGRPPRTCLVCGEPGAVCAAGAVHGAPEIRAAAETILDRRVPSDSPRISQIALRAVLEEVAVDPKPGLVTPSSRGAHGDMDYFTFLAGAAALAPWFGEAAVRGASLARFDSFGSPGARTRLDELRDAGREAERAMFEATGGVNTHKGLVFSLGALCAAAGYLSARGSPATPEACCAAAGALARAVTGADFEAAAARPEAERTAGERLHGTLGAEGVRGEAARGFPSALRIGLPRLRSGRAAGLSRNDALAESLLELYGAVEDTCVLARGGPGGLDFLRSGAARARGLGGLETEAGRAAVRELDRDLVARNLSPGGCADLLAVTSFLDRLG